MSNKIDKSLSWRFYERFQDDTFIVIFGNEDNEFSKCFDMNDPVISNFVEKVIKPMIEEFRKNE